MKKRFLAGITALAVAAGGTAALAQAPKPAPKAWVGIAAEAMAEGKGGLVIRDVTPDSPAAKAGLREGDVLQRIGDLELKDFAMLAEFVGRRKPGDSIDLWFQRDGKEQKTTLVLGQRPEAGFIGGLERFRDLPGFAAEFKGAYLGVHTQELTKELKERLGLTADSGAVVVEVMPDSPAAKAGLKQDDVIVAVNDKAVVTPEELREAVRAMEPGKEVTIKAARGKEMVQVKATLGQAPRQFGFGGAIPGMPGMPGLPGTVRALPPGVELPLLERQKKIQELEKRIQDLENRLRELEQKSKPARPPQ